MYSVRISGCLLLFLFFLKGNRGVVGRELEGEEEGEYVVGIYCMREDWIRKKEGIEEKETAISLSPE